MDVAAKANVFIRNIFHTLMIVQQKMTSPSVKSLGGHDEKHFCLLAKNFKGKLQVRDEEALGLLWS